MKAKKLRAQLIRIKSYLKGLLPNLNEDDVRVTLQSSGLSAEAAHRIYHELRKKAA